MAESSTTAAKMSTPGTLALAATGGVGCRKDPACTVDLTGDSGAGVGATVLTAGAIVLATGTFVVTGVRVAGAF